MTFDGEPKKQPGESGLRKRRGLRLRDLFDLAYSSPWPWASFFALALTVLLTPFLSFRAQQYELGQISPTTVHAPYDFSYEDEVGTAARRFHIRRGKTIVRAGDEITASVLRQLDILSSLSGLSGKNRRWGFAGALGAFLLAGVLLTIQWHLLKPARASEAWRRQSFAMTGIVIVGHLALARLAFFVARLFSEQLVLAPFNNTGSYSYAVPFASVAVMLLLLENAPTALLATTLFSTAIGIMTGNLQLAVFSLLSSLAAILGLFQYKRRTALVKVGLLVGAVNVAAVLAIDLLSGRHFPASNFGFDLACAPPGGAAGAGGGSARLPRFRDRLPPHDRHWTPGARERQRRHPPAARARSPGHLPPQHGRGLARGGRGRGGRRELPVFSHGRHVPP